MVEENSYLVSLGNKTQYFFKNYNCKLGQIDYTQNIFFDPDEELKFAIFDDKAPILT